MVAIRDSALLMVCSGFLGVVSSFFFVPNQECIAANMEGISRCFFRRLFVMSVPPSKSLLEISYTAFSPSEETLVDVLCTEVISSLSSVRKEFFFVDTLGLEGVDADFFGVDFFFFSLVFSFILGGVITSAGLVSSRKSSALGTEVFNRLFVMSCAVTSFFCTFGTAGTFVPCARAASPSKVRIREIE